MNQEADASDHQQHDQRKLIKDEAEVDVKCAEGDPLAKGFSVREIKIGPIPYDKLSIWMRNAEAEGDQYD